MPLINYLTRIQALDKFLALYVEGHLDSYADGDLITVLHFERLRNQATQVGEYAQWIAEVSNWLIVVDGEGALARQFTESAKAAAKPVHTHVSGSVSEQAIADAIFEQVDQATGKTNLVILRSNVDRLGGRLAERTRRSGGMTVRYFKSIHDSGMGITAPKPTLPRVIGRRVTRASARRSDPTLAEIGRRSITRVTTRARDLVKGPSEMYYVYDQAEAVALRWRKGKPSSRIMRIEYPLHGRKWRAFLEQEARRRGLGSEQPTVALFLRGVIHFRPDDPENQIMPSSLLVTLLGEIRRALESVANGWRILVKLHPNQNGADFGRHAARAGLHDYRVVHHPPGLICAMSDVVISTHSSTCLDALAFGVPSIDYYRATAAFNEIHPGGRPFARYGVTVASQEDELRRFLRDATSRPIRAKRDGS